MHCTLQILTYSEFFWVTAVAVKHGMNLLPDRGLEPALAVVTAETAFDIVAVVKQQAHHHLVLQTVLQRSREHGVAERREVAVDVSSILQQQADQFVLASPYGHQEAAKWVLIGPRPRPEQRLGTGNVIVGDGEVECAVSHVAVAL